MARIHTIGILACIFVMGVIVALGPYSHSGMFLEDKGINWYYCKLPERAFWGQFWAWSLYGLHQVSLWGLIAYAQIKRPKYINGLHPINMIAIGVNLLFVALHIVQTKFYYDGLAQDTHVRTSQFSVIFMLVFILMMENGRRGLFFGHKVKFLDEPGGFLRKYHGYYFAWAITYTFWFHPIEDQLGHLLGTFYTLMLLLQGSLFFTRAHRDRVWTMLLEVFVLIHGALVAYVSLSSDKWSMFLFGFFTIFVVTQMHGIGLGNKARWGIVLTYVASLAFVYSGEGTRIAEVIRIPLGEYGLVFIMAGIIWVPIFIRAKLKSRTVGPMYPEAS